NLGAASSLGGPFAERALTKLLLQSGNDRARAGRDYPICGNNEPYDRDQAHAGRRIEGKATSHYPAEFSSLVISHAPCAGEKTSLSDTGTCVSSKIECNQPRILAWLSVNHVEACPRQRDNDTAILYLNAEPDRLGHGF